MSDCKAKIPNYISAGDPPQTPLGELTDSIAGFKGPTSKGRGEEMREWREAKCTLYFFADLRPCLSQYIFKHLPNIFYLFQFVQHIYFQTSTFTHCSSTK